MIEGDRRHDGDARVEHVGRVPRAAHAHLDGGHVDRRVGERRVGHGHQDLEERHPWGARLGAPGVDEVDVGENVVIGRDEPLRREGLAVDGDALAHFEQVRTGEASGAQAVLAEQPLGHPRRRGLAVRPRHVDGAERVLRVPEQPADLGDAVEGRHEVVLRRPAEEGFLDIGHAGSDAVRRCHGPTILLAWAS